MDFPKPNIYRLQVLGQKKIHYGTYTTQFQQKNSTNDAQKATKIILYSNTDNTYTNKNSNTIEEIHCHGFYKHTS